MLSYIFSLFTAASVFVLRSNNDPLFNITIPLDEYYSVDTMMAFTCPMLLEKHMSSESCKSSNGARIISQYGKRITTMSDIKSQDVLHMVFAHSHFVYHQPLGVPFRSESGFTLTQISYSPRVFLIEETILNDIQIDELISVSSNQFYMSTTGDPRQASVSKFRTSENTVDVSTNASKTIKNTAFRMLAIDEVDGMAEPLQVVRYAPGQYYLPHTDYFETDQMYNPMVNNGTNRFATLFVYLNTITDGGETIFPLAYEKRFLGSQWDLEMFQFECTPSANVIRVAPKKGTGILFYSQHPNGTLDATSVHGACPPFGKTKIAANLWMWNRVAKLEGECPAGDVQTNVQIHNAKDFDLDIFWDKDSKKDCSLSKGCVFVMTLPGKNSSILNTFFGHVFHLYDKNKVYIDSLTIQQ
jgi:prolyl 4-hydroxylase